MAKSYKKAIINKCKECIYDDKGGNGNWRQQVSNCTAKTCPLYEVRPLSSTHEELDVSIIGKWPNIEDHRFTPTEGKITYNGDNITAELPEGATVNGKLTAP